ncbi:beta-galactosidase [Muricomes intestini]|jgi:beta-galactosidase|uniref:Beta-galactosidase n=1 Tax=Muricomes intestini TaxID=1796634 RepID=A0A4V2UR67_9FIRM|nr:beta-galactosidase [Muricomes intestini]TCS74705.1 beta-galactosidase [Muricomes intestini]HAX51400.1 beta-galactosidase [Lachnospiraceae bacterium]
MNSKQNYQWKEMTMAVCYYPEHWDKTLWEDDLNRMLDAGITVIRIAEFAWSLFEPEEGRFQFDFFDEFLELCLEKKMKIIMGTPTATPPAWLTEKYPEVLNCNIEGIPYRHGGRKHYNYNAPVYQELSARIVTWLAEHYGSHPAVVGWQVDNELNCETCEFYSEADSAAFRVFLEKRYKTLEALNQAWGTVFWNQTYTDWKQIYIPRLTLNKGVNPHMHLDYFRFISDSTLRYCGMQAGILRKYIKAEDFITTNGMFWNVDNHRMQKDCLDVYTYDSYPSFAFGLDRYPKTATDLNDRKWTKHLHEVRSICPHFGIMEQQSGANGWSTRMEGPAPRPGQLTLWAMQSVAQGADFISFFRWRTCTFGTEIYWHGILDYDNRDNRKLAEVKEFYKKLKTLNPVCGSQYVAGFALLKDYDNEWDTEVDVWHERVNSFSEEEIFIASELNHTPYDVVYLQEDSELEDLIKYPVVFYPHPILMEKKRVDLLKQYVEQGGTLIIGCRSGYKDLNGKCVMMPQPGLLKELTGSDVKDFTFTSSAEEEVYAIWNKEKMEMPVFNDIMDASEDARVLASYENSYYKGEAALIEHSVGGGRVLHLGSAFSRKNVTQLLKYTEVIEPFAAWIEAPNTVEVVMRKKDGKTFLFVLNFQSFAVSVTLKQEMKLLYTGESVMGDVILPAYGTAVYEVI